jgi:hypothetical protein
MYKIKNGQQITIKLNKFHLAFTCEVTTLTKSTHLNIINESSGTIKTTKNDGMCVLRDEIRSS